MSLADRILVIIDGQTRQIGTPEELYARPEHADVAEFMGYRNLFPTAMEAADQGIGVTVGGARLLGTLVGAAGGMPGARAIVAIRPDDMHPTGDGPIVATVDIAEYHGRDFSAVARLADGAELFFRSAERVTPGEVVRLDVAPARVLVYPGMSASHTPAGGLSLRRRLREHGLDSVTLLVVPGVLLVLVLFIYPPVYGLVLSVFHPENRAAIGWPTTRTVLHRSVPL